MKKTINWLMAMMLLVQLVMPGLVAFAEDEGIMDGDPVVLSILGEEQDEEDGSGLPDFSEHQYFELAEGSKCTLNEDKDLVYPSFTPGANTYAYVANILDKKTNDWSSYFYYGGASKSTKYTCVAGTLDEETNECVVPMKGCILGEEFEGACYSCGLSSGREFNQETGKCDKAAEEYNYKASCGTGRRDVACRAVNDGIYDGFLVGSPQKWYYCNKGDVLDTTTLKCVASAQTKDASGGGVLIDLDPIKTPAIPTPDYTIADFDLSELALPNLDPTNKTGYDIKFYPLNEAKILGVDLILEGVIGANPDIGEWKPLLSLGLPNVVTDFVLPLLNGTTDLTCGINTELPEQIDSCKLSDIPNILAGLTSAFGNLVDGDFVNNLGGLASLGGDIASALNGLQNGQFDPDTLGNIWNGLSSLSLPDFTAVGASLNDVADSLEAAQACLRLLGADVSDLITVLRQNATNFNNIGNGITALQTGIEKLSDFGKNPKADLLNLADLAEGLADLLEGVSRLPAGIADLLGAMGSLGGIANLGDLGQFTGLLSQISNLLTPITQITDPLILPLRHGAGILRGVINAFDQQIPWMPLPLTCANAGTYKSDIINYIDAQIGYYDGIKGHINALLTARGINSAEVTAALDFITTGLTTAKNGFEAINVAQFCDAQAMPAVAMMAAPVMAPMAAPMVLPQPDLEGLQVLFATAHNYLLGHMGQVKVKIFWFQGFAFGHLGSHHHHLGSFIGHVKDKLQGALERILGYLESNKLPAPEFADTCYQTGDTKMTLEMEDYGDKENEVWGYLGILTNKDTGTKTLFMLHGGEAAEGQIPAGNYSLNVRTIGMDSFIHASEVFGFLDEVEFHDYHGFFNHVSSISVPSGWQIVREFGPHNNGASKMIAILEKIDHLKANLTGPKAILLNSLFNDSANYEFGMCEDTETPTEPQFCGENAAHPLLKDTYGASYQGAEPSCTPPAGLTCHPERVAIGEDDTEDADHERVWICQTPPTTGGGGGGSGGGSSGGIPQVEEVEEVLEADIPTTTSSDKCSILGSEYSDEENAAYQYACENGITTMDPISTARLEDPITRAELAKVLSQYVISTTDRKPDTSKDCSAFEASIAHYSNDLPNYMKLACQLNIMGVHPDYTPLSDFRPDQYVTRAEFATVFSRILWGNRFEGTDTDWSSKHLQALKAAKILANDDPSLIEKRSWIFLMIHRSIPEQAAPAADVPAEVEEETTE